MWKASSCVDDHKSSSLILTFRVKGISMGHSDTRLVFIYLYNSYQYQIKSSCLVYPYSDFIAKTAQLFTGPFYAVFFFYCKNSTNYLISLFLLTLFFLCLCTMCSPCKFPQRGVNKGTLILMVILSLVTTHLLSRNSRHVGERGAQVRDGAHLRHGQLVLHQRHNCQVSIPLSSVGGTAAFQLLCFTCVGLARGSSLTR